MNRGPSIAQAYDFLPAYSAGSMGPVERRCLRLDDGHRKAKVQHAKAAWASQVINSHGETDDDQG